MIVNTFLGGVSMSTSISTIRLNDNVKEETTSIADKLGLSFNAVVNILLQKFNEERGFPFPVKLEDCEKTVFDMNSDEFEELCREAVAEREAAPSQDYVTLIDEDSGLLMKKFKDGKVEYIAGC